VVYNIVPFNDLFIVHTLLDFKVAEELYGDLIQIPLTCRQYDIHIRLKEDLLNTIYGFRGI
jgi:hypothetical protein